MSQVYPVALVTIKVGRKIHFGTFRDFVGIRAYGGLCRTIVCQTLGKSQGSDWRRLTPASKFAIEACEAPLVEFLWSAYALGSDLGHQLYELNDEGRRIIPDSFYHSVRQASKSFSPRDDWKMVWLETKFSCMRVAMRARIVWTDGGMFQAYKDFGLLAKMEEASDSRVEPSFAHFWRNSGDEIEDKIDPINAPVYSDED